MNDEKVIEKAKELGATKFTTGINWQWANGFPSEESAKSFVAFLESYGYDHRGVYPPSPTEYPHDSYAVRWR